jgi:hypothetical protein
MARNLRTHSRGGSLVNIHSGQPDQQKVIDFQSKEVLPRMKSTPARGNHATSVSAARSTACASRRRSSTVLMSVAALKKVTPGIGSASASV